MVGGSVVLGLRVLLRLGNEHGSWQISRLKLLLQVEQFTAHAGRKLRSAQFLHLMKNNVLQRDGKPHRSLPRIPQVSGRPCTCCLDWLPVRSNHRQPAQQGYLRLASHLRVQTQNSQASVSVVPPALETVGSSLEWSGFSCLDRSAP